MVKKISKVEQLRSGVKCTLGVPENKTDRRYYARSVFCTSATLLNDLCDDLSVEADSVFKGRLKIIFSQILLLSLTLLSLSLYRITLGCLYLFIHQFVFFCILKWYMFIFKSLITSNTFELESYI